MINCRTCEVDLITLLGFIFKREIMSSKKIINSDGTVNKMYVKKMWNIVMDAMIDSFNGDADDADINRRFNGFEIMVNDIVSS